MKTRCLWLIQPEGKDIRSVEARGVNVLEQAALPGTFAPERPTHAPALQCGRTNIVSAEPDDEVLELGIPLYIVEVTESRSGRLGALEISDGQYRYRLLEGNLTEAEAEAVTGLLNAFQDRAQRRSNVPRSPSNSVAAPNRSPRACRRAIPRFDHADGKAEWRFDRPSPNGRGLCRGGDGHGGAEREIREGRRPYLQAE